MMTSALKTLTLALPTALFAAAAPLHANDALISPVSLTPVENTRERINFSGKLRMLSQRIPAVACHLERGIETENATALLEAATAEFEQILAALEFGDEDLNIIAAEDRRKTLVRIHELRTAWEPFKAAADAVIAGTATDTDITYLLTENMAILASAQLLVEELVKQYTNPNAATRASLMLIDISGRQRMLTQKMSKESCMLGTAHQTAQTQSDLEGTTQIFEASLEALRFGMPAVGIGPPPNTEIADGLQDVLDQWTSLKPMVSELVAGGTLDAADQTITFDGLNATMGSMNTVVELYAAATGSNS